MSGTQQKKLPSSHSGSDGDHSDVGETLEKDFKSSMGLLMIDRFRQLHYPFEPSNHWKMDIKDVEGPIGRFNALQLRWYWGEEEVNIFKKHCDEMKKAHHAHFERMQDFLAKTYGLVYPPLNAAQRATLDEIIQKCYKELWPFIKECYNFPKKQDDVTREIIGTMFHGLIILGFIHEIGNTPKATGPASGEWSKKSVKIGATLKWLYPMAYQEEPINEWDKILKETQEKERSRRENEAEWSKQCQEEQMKKK